MVWWIERGGSCSEVVVVLGRCGDDKRSEWVEMGEKSAVSDKDGWK